MSTEEVTQPTIEEPAVVEVPAEEPPQEETPAAAPKKRGRKKVEEATVTTEAPTRKPRAPRKKAEKVVIEQVNLEVPTPTPDPVLREQEQEQEQETQLQPQPQPEIPVMTHEEFVDNLQELQKQARQLRRQLKTDKYKKLLEGRI